MIKRFSVGVITALFAASTWANILTYTQSESGTDKIPLGYPVPLPVDSLTPLDGFRTYESLNLRHQQLTEQSENIRQLQIGETFENRPIWAYSISDDNNLTQNGLREASVLINGGIHAREWQSPEVLTGYMEMLYESQNDNYIGQFLLNNLNVVLIPVLNVDGFLQTQRYPAQVTSSEETPRDGRMRRKNMRGADGELSTVVDNLKGIDLNRNNDPYWATSNSSSSNTDSLIYHGNAPGSEPEISALQQAAVVAGEDRLRFYTDTHSFSQIYLTSNTSNTRRNSITSRLGTIMRAVNNYKYAYSAAANGVGIGTTEEYFTNTYEIPSFTLELEPKNSAQDYGGIAGGHSGFILPNSEVSRMRKEKNNALLVGLYAITQVPYVSSIQIKHADTGEEVFAMKWQFDENGGSLVKTTENSLNSSTPYSLSIVFNKPMRWIENGKVADYSTLSDALDIELSLLAKTNEGDTSWIIDSENGEWTLDAYKLYKTDTFSVPFELSSDFEWSALNFLTLEISTRDFSGYQLDTNPATRVDWALGAWTNYEDTNGDNDTDTGGIDRSMRLIDDGSALYTDSEPDPAPVPLPVPPSSADHDGGGTFTLAGLLFLTILTLNRNRSKSARN